MPCEEALKHVLCVMMIIKILNLSPLTYDGHPLVFLRDLEAVGRDLAAVDPARPEVDLLQPDVRRDARRQLR